MLNVPEHRRWCQKGLVNVGNGRRLALVESDENLGKGHVLWAVALTPPNRGDYGGGCKYSDLVPCVPSQPDGPIILVTQHAMRVVAPKCIRASMALSVERFESRLVKKTSGAPVLDNLFVLLSDMAASRN